MLKKKITIINKLGLHARAAAKFVSYASRYVSDIHVEKNGRIVNGKSIMGVMTLAAANGTEIEITVSGEDEDHAMQSLNQLINDKFGEKE